MGVRPVIPIPHRPGKQTGVAVVVLSSIGLIGLATAGCVKGARSSATHSAVAATKVLPKGKRVQLLWLHVPTPWRDRAIDLLEAHGIEWAALQELGIWVLTVPGSEAKEAERVLSTADPELAAILASPDRGPSPPPAPSPR